MKPMIWGEDSPRARTTDPITSQVAADRSQVTLTPLRKAVLALMFVQGNAMKGSDINWAYAKHQPAHEERGWPRCHWDSPRKRAGELAADGFLVIVGRSEGESVYALPELREV